MTLPLMPTNSLEGLTIKDEHLARALRGEEFLVLDGAMGTMLQAAGLTSHGELPDMLNITHPHAITDIHRAYVRAGAQVITANTFGSNACKLGRRASVENVFQAAVANVRAAGARYVAADIGPLGALLQPLGTLSFEDAYNLFAEQVCAAVNAGCDLIIIETMTDIREIKAAILAAKENSTLPLCASMTFGEDGRTFLGTSPEIAAITLSSLGAHIVGINCSLGPAELFPLAQAFTRFSRCPVCMRPNAGLPRIEDGQTVYDMDAQKFTDALERIIELGVTVVGGCCGTNPSFIEGVAALVSGRIPASREFSSAFCVTSAQEAVIVPAGHDAVAVVGERINPTGKPQLKAALCKGDYDYLVGEAVAQQQAGADILDVNVGLPELDEPSVLRAVVEKLQATVTAPLQIDSSDPQAIEAAVRGYGGKPLINSVNGKQESLAVVLPLVRRYGCAVIGLTLDEAGIPSTAEERLAIAQRIVEAAESCGIPRSDIAIDCLVMAAATNQDDVREILRAVTLVKNMLGVRTVLGVSNVSFGLPQRNLMNATFLAAALGAGLDLPIINPLSARYRDVVASFRVLNGQDRGSLHYIENYAQKEDPYSASCRKEGMSALHAERVLRPDHTGLSGEEEANIAVPEELADVAEEVSELVRFILAGRATPMVAATQHILKNHDPLAVVNGVFIPTLDLVGEKFDRGEFFLPQLMASAEAVKAGFDVVRTRVATPSSKVSQQQGQAILAQQTGTDTPEVSSGANKTIALATVQGDIHDIGKNIVKMLLENYGFSVIDLGRDVAPEAVVAAVKKHAVRLVGLSALMTTTVAAMEETIILLRRQVPQVAVMVGGAVITSDYAQAIGADYYAKDAAESARIAIRFFDGSL